MNWFWSKTRTFESVAYTWQFPKRRDVRKLTNASEDEVLQSDKFDYDGCKFYLECTPNGYSSVSSPTGQCTLWLAVASLPDGIGKLDITVRFTCPEIRYDAKRRSPKLGNDSGASWSVGMLDTIQKSKFRFKDSLTFKCYITIHEKKQRVGDDNGDLIRKLAILSSVLNSDDDITSLLSIMPQLLSPRNQIAETLIYSWKFPTSSDVRKLTNASDDEVLQSDKFDYDGCKFYLECTPNGFSSASSPAGECTLWLAVASLPDGIGKLDITVRFICAEINYDANRRTAKLGNDSGASWSVGMLDTTQKSKFNYKSSLTFKCYVTIHEKKQRVEDDSGDLIRKLAILSSVLDSDDDDEKVETMSNVAYISRYQKVQASSSTNDIILTYFYGQNKYYVHVEKNQLSKGCFKTAYKAIMYKSEVITNSSVGTPKIADGTSVVLKVKHRNDASDVSRPRPVLKRSGWNTDLQELERLREYCEQWNKNKYSDKTYEGSRAFVLKVSDEGNDGTGQFQKGEYVLVEPFMPHFEKWNWPVKAEEFAKAYSIQAFGHFTYHHSNGKELVNDAQGYRDDNKYTITDPYYVEGDDGRCAVWFQNHECNQFCKSWWKRPNGVQMRQLSPNFAYGKIGQRNSRSIRSTGWQ